MDALCKICYVLSQARERSLDLESLCCHSFALVSPKTRKTVPRDTYCVRSDVVLLFGATKTWQKNLERSRIHLFCWHFTCISRLKPRSRRHFTSLLRTNESIGCNRCAFLVLVSATGTWILIDHYFSIQAMDDRLCPTTTASICSFIAKSTTIVHDRGG